MNPFFLQMANIREQCFWVIDNVEKATGKAKGMVAAAVSRVRNHEPLYMRSVEMNPSDLVVVPGSRLP
ncbi:hypothetical protein ACFLXI_06605 [Chloroflexota bacterium]